MAGKFTDTKYTDNFDSLVSGIKDTLNRNPFYKFTDKKATKVTYYKQNIEKTTTDEGSEEIYQTIGTKSSVKYNKINNFYIFGFEQPVIDNQIGEFGYEVDDITGSVVVLPKTIVPTSGDYFKVHLIDEDFLFIINDANGDTFNSMQEYYKCDYRMTKRDVLDQIENQVVKEYNFVFGNVGTDFSPVIEAKSYGIIRELDEVVHNLVSLYHSYFANNVQTFIYTLNPGYRMYDPYLIEFLIRNDIFKGQPDYIFVDHQVPVPNTFAYDYSRTFFYVLENPNEMDRRGFNDTCSATQITDVNTLFFTRVEPYYRIEYRDIPGYISRFNIFPGEVKLAIKNKTYFKDESMKIFNILVSYLNGDEDYLNGNIVDCIKYLDYQENKEYFYMIPICIFIINKFCESLMK